MLPLIIGALPVLINIAEKLIPDSDKGSEKKELVMSIMGALYDKFLQGVIPDLPGVDEKKIVLEILSHLVDFLVKKYFPK